MANLEVKPRLWDGKQPARTSAPSQRASNVHTQSCAWLKGLGCDHTRSHLNNHPWETKGGHMVKRFAAGRKRSPGLYPSDMKPSSRYNVKRKGKFYVECDPTYFLFLKMFLEQSQGPSNTEQKVQRLPTWALPPHTRTAPLTTSVPHHRGIFITTNEPTGTWHQHPHPQCMLGFTPGVVCLVCLDKRQ